MTDPLVVARRVAVLLVLAAVAAGAMLGGLRGALAAALGAGLSAINLWALERLAARAAQRAVAEGPAVAVSGLTAGLGVKTSLLLVTVWLMTRGAGVPLLPFAMGLLVFVVALVIAGLHAGLAEAR